MKSNLAGFHIFLDLINKGSLGTENIIMIILINYKILPRMWCQSKPIAGYNQKREK
jgi:hypothetical protein